MKKSILTLTGVAVIITLTTVGCTKKTSASADSKSSRENVDDSISLVSSTNPEEPSLKVETFSAELGESKLSVQYPVEGPTVLVNAIRNWENQTLADSYGDSIPSQSSGNLSDGQAFFNYYKKKMHYYNDEWTEFQIDEIKLADLTDLSTTFIYSGYEYGGGAHGIGIEYGVTFRNSDGAIFKMSDINTSSPDFRKALANGLKEYFEDSMSDEPIYETIINSPKEIPLPSLDPWISGDKLIFRYTSYEIASYAAGYPTAEIPLSQAMSFLTAKGKTFVE